MIEMHPTVVLLLAEALAVLALVQVVTLVLAWLRRRREHAAVAQLVTAVSDDAEARRERNGAVIASALGADGDALQGHVKGIEQASKLVLQRVVLGWSRRDASSVAGLPEVLEGLNARWRELLGATGGAARAVDDTADKGHEEALATLRAEKKAVEDELAITRATMNRMLEEYAAMYHRGDRSNSATAPRSPEEDSTRAETAAPASRSATTTEPPATARREEQSMRGTATGNDDAGDVTEDDLDALFDARPDRRGNGTVSEPMPADLEIEDPFEGLEEEPLADDTRRAAGEQQGATSVSAG